MSDDCVAISINGFTADGVTPDGDGIVWTVASLLGWWEQAPIFVNTEEVQPVGEIATTAREQGRPLVLTLDAHASGGQTALGPTLCLTATDSIIAPFKCVYAPAVLEVTDPVLTLHASVRRVGAIKSRMLGASVAQRFEIQLFAPDPYRYDIDDNPFD